ncbi:hypothetical protein [Nitrososphaeria virus YSH_462411]|uniref:Uncharacterized protein n=1 Tax=Nitrososphaeria virus YSH_462411 TaxID=3071321 RepID=A0A976UAG9_9CAUD|nr:hypothetical protein QKV92_gp21 [Yangshan Harbor Nitrososphaeria virus]UVF62293.1 hypothetical protein [Nitrososphaeria virus YSH_462411]
MLYNAPHWVFTIFQWLKDGMIDQITVNNAMNWMLEKGLIIPIELI